MTKSAYKVRTFISGIIIFLLFAQMQVTAQDFLVKKDYRMDWVFLDEDENIMLPFLDNSRENPVSIHLKLETDYGKNAVLMLEIPAGTGLFLNNKFITHYENNAVRLLDFDSLVSLIDPSSLQLTLYNEKGFQNPVDAQIGFRHESFDLTTYINPITKRESDKRSEYLKIVILVLFTFFVILQTLFPSDLLDFLNIRLVFTFRYTDTLISKYRSLTKTQILVIVYQAALLSGLLVVFLNYYNDPFTSSFFSDYNPIIGWLTFFVLVLLLFVFKYILISILSYLFDLADRINFYFIEFLRMSMIFYTLLFLTVSYVIINKFYLVENLLSSLIILIVAFNAIRFIMLYFKFRSTVAMKNLHLFSYLCTTELIPIILGLRFFIK